MIGPEPFRFRQERNVLHSPSLFASIFDAIPDAAVVTDRRHRIQLVNRRFEQIFAVEASAVQGTYIHKLFESREDAGTPEGSFSTVHRIPGGREFPVELVSTEIKDADDEPAGYFYSVRDVSERRTAEEALRTSERQYGSLFEQANDALIIFEPEDERILEVNPRACELYGFSREEFVGRSLQTLTEDVGRGREAINDILTNGGIRNFESRHFRKDGHSLYLQISCSLIHFDARRAVLTIIRDISEQKEAERALRAAKEAAEEATRMKSDFVAKVSHEIRTPMNGVIGMTELLMETTLTDCQREYAESIAHSGESLLKLINDLLDFSKIEAGKLELEHIPFDPNRIIGELVELFTPSADAKHTRIAYYVDADVPCNVIGDPYRIRQVLSNLVSNAIKFTENGEIIVNVSAEEGSGSRTALVCEVADTGIGILPEQQERLFEAFTQAGSDTARNFGGTGLGLAISRQLVTLMDGSIDARSVHGEGSTFRFSVLVDRREDADSSEVADDVTLNRLRVLVVDSSENMRSIVCRYLDGWNVDVFEASTGSEALNEVRTTADAFDVVLIERDLTDMDVLALARSVRSASPSAHVVLVTRFAERALSQSERQAGIDACLPRPLWPHRLRECLAVASNHASDGPAAPVHPAPTAVDCSSDVAPPPMASILLVEDNVTNQKVASAMLRRCGVEIEIAPNGAQALEKLERGSYDLVLMDCQMPVMDGFEATKHIRNLPGDRARIPVIALTANAVKGDRERCYAAGMDDYLTKPFRPDIIRATLDRWLPGRIAA